MYQFWGAFWTITVQCVNLYKKCQKETGSIACSVSPLREHKGHLSQSLTHFFPLCSCLTSCVSVRLVLVVFFDCSHAEAEAIKFRSDHRTVTISHRSRYSGNLSSCL